MIILRLKLFRRDDFNDQEIIDVDLEIFNKLGFKLQIETSNKYNSDISKLGIKGSPNRKRLEELKRDIRNMYLTTDGPSGGDTHYLGDFSKPGKYYTFSKKITEEHRLNYKVYPPEIITKNNNKKYIQRIVLESCYDHELPEGNYLEDKDLRERKDRMRGNAPYRNKTSILSKKKHGNNRSNTKRT